MKGSYRRGETQITIYFTFVVMALIFIALLLLWYQLAPLLASLKVMYTVSTASVLTVLMHNAES